MFILIEYNRRKGEVVSMRRFADAEWSCGVDAQFALEKSVMQRGIDHEVVQSCGLRIAEWKRLSRIWFGEIERTFESLETGVRSWERDGLRIDGGIVLR